MDNAKVVFVLGAPGAGKGTQCAKIVENFGWTHLSAGDLLRSEVAAGSELGQQAREIMQRGGMVPSSLMLDLLVNAMTSSGSGMFLIDGFPRTLDQLEEFEAKVKPCDGVLVFTVPSNVAVERLLARGESSGREDDNEGTILKRMEGFNAESQPVIEALKERGRVVEISAAEGPDDVFEEVRSFMEKMDAPSTEEEPAADEAGSEEAGVEEAGAEEAPVAEQAEEQAPATEHAEVEEAPAAEGAEEAEEAPAVEDAAAEEAAEEDTLAAEEAVAEEVAPAIEESSAADEAAGEAPTAEEAAEETPAVEEGANEDSPSAEEGVPAAEEADRESPAMEEVPSVEEAVDAEEGEVPAAEEAAAEEGEAAVMDEAAAEGEAAAEEGEAWAGEEAAAEGGAAAEDAAPSTQEAAVEETFAGEAAAEDATAAEEAAEQEGSSAVEAAAEEAPAAEDAPEAEEAMQARAAAEEAPAAQEAGIEDLPADEEAAVEDAPAAEEAEAEDLPAAGEAVAEQESSTAEEPAVEETPAADEAAVEDAPSTGEVAADDEDPAAEEDPATEQAAVEVRPAEEVLAAEEAPESDIVAETEQAAAEEAPEGEYAAEAEQAAAEEAADAEEALVAEPSVAAEQAAPEAGEVVEEAVVAQEEEEEEEEEEDADDGGDAFSEAPVARGAVQQAPSGRMHMSLDIGEEDVKVKSLRLVRNGSNAGGGTAAAEGSAVPVADADAGVDAALSVPMSAGELAGRVPALLVVSGPSGVGKGALVRRLASDFPDTFALVVSHTTREPRDGEVDSQDYHFVSHDVASAAIESGAFLEYAFVHGAIYGTSIAAVAAAAEGGRLPLLDVDVQGAEQLRAGPLSSSSVLLFVAPPSIDVLEAQLREAGGHDDEALQLRLGNARDEVDRAREPGLFHKVLVNDSADRAYGRLKRYVERFLPGTLPAGDVPPPSRGNVGSKPTTPLAAAAPMMPVPPPGKPNTPPSGRVASITPQKPAPPRGSKPVTPLVGGDAAAAHHQQQQRLVPVKALPVRQYMDQTVVPILREGLRSLNDTRPADPLQFLADYLLAARAKRINSAGTN